MTPLATYGLQAFLCSLVFYAYYRFFLSRKTHFCLNRIYLLLIIPMSLLIPAIHIPVHMQATAVEGKVLLPLIRIGDQPAVAQGWINPLPFLLLIIYVSGSLFFLIRSIHSLTYINKIRRQSQISEAQGLTLAWHNLPIAPFSFGRTIYMNVSVRQHPGFENILLHECTHVRQQHTLDILFVELLCILGWFNPIHHLIKSSIREQLEYLADAAALSQQDTGENYLSLLFGSGYGLQPIIAHHFHISLTKKRFTMVTKHFNQRSGPWAALLSLPLLASLFLAFTCQVGQANVSHTAVLPSSSQVVITSPDANDFPTNPAVQDKDGFQAVKVQPVYPGGHEAMVKYIIKALKYPDLPKKKGIEGTVYIQFTITETGKVTDAQIVKSVDPELDKEALRVISAMPHWTPGKNDKGQAVAVKTTLPVKFKLTKDKE